MEIDNFNKNVVEKLQELYKTGEFQNILILGAVGTGKTFLARNIFRDFWFIDEPSFKLCIASKMAIFRGHNEFGCNISYYPLEALSKKDCVIYDDIGSCDLSPAYVEKMLFWINFRMNRGKRTIFTSNLSIKELQERENRIASRILQNAIVFQLSGPDRRKNNLQIFK